MGRSVVNAFVVNELRLKTALETGWNSGENRVEFGWNARGTPRSFG